MVVAIRADLLPLLGRIQLEALGWCQITSFRLARNTRAAWRPPSGQLGVFVAMRQPTASQTNAVKFFRHHLTQLPHNVDEFDGNVTRAHEEVTRLAPLIIIIIIIMIIIIMSAVGCPLLDIGLPYSIDPHAFGSGLFHLVSLRLYQAKAMKIKSKSDKHFIRAYTRLKRRCTKRLTATIREQIDMAEKPSASPSGTRSTTETKYSPTDVSSLIERILRDAWDAGVKFETFVVGNRVHAHGARCCGGSRRAAALHVPGHHGVSYIMQTISKVIVGAQALLADGSVRGALGTAQRRCCARAERAVLVACENAQGVRARAGRRRRPQRAGSGGTQLLAYKSDPDDLIDKSDPNSPLKDWRSNCNLTPLN
ncbi:hypothetical protein MSG28_010730 [Choristoneura fumiferana]|uniref:Uncharacterized protein n=1 Tax=Choristoneura fumiferana TaxID=7141 RepID=A0ACC0KNQ4_CHOFU|nr:hypothetical protein MSG28_010730 [Choristoneura fumiferana]